MRSASNPFSTGADDYARFRPHYPEALYARIAALLERRETAWDCATGTGQALAGLAPRFRTVVASDTSTAQLAQVAAAANVHRLVARAEQAPLRPATMDLVTVAQALHWFDTAAFFEEARRVLRRGGVLAVWSYQLFKVDAAVDGVVERFYHDTLGAYWPPQRQLVDDGYAGIAWPATAEIATAPLSMSLTWTVEHLLAYLGTWSAVKCYRSATDQDPMPGAAAALRRAWGERPARDVTWPLILTTVRWRD